MHDFIIGTIVSLVGIGIMLLVILCIGATQWSRIKKLTEALDNTRRIARCAHARTEEHNISIGALEDFWQSRGPCKACGKHRYQADFPTDTLCGAHPIGSYSGQGEMQLDQYSPRNPMDISA